MSRALGVVVVLGLVQLSLPIGCSSSENSEGAGSGGSAGSAGSATGGATGGNGASSGTGGSGATTSCADLGGQCQCAGGCETGFHSAGLVDCPQPCDGCGACGQECCVPDVSDAGADGSLFSQCGDGGTCPVDLPAAGSPCTPTLCCEYNPPGSIFTACSCDPVSGWVCTAAGVCSCL